MRVKISVGETFGKVIEESIKNLNKDLIKRINLGVRDVSKKAVEKIKEKAAARLYNTKDQYILAMKMDEIGSGVYSITLDASAAHLEKGYDSYDMKKGLLHLGKSIPMNAKGEPAIKVSKAGYRYRAIPFDKNMSAAKSDHRMHNRPEGTFGPNMIDRMRPTTTGESTKGIRDQAKAGGYDGVTKHNNGNPVIGKVASARPNPNNKHQIFIKDHETGQEKVHTVGRETHPNSQGWLKYQWLQKNRNGGTTVKSAYMTFRIVSENPAQAHKWIHPGFRGIHAFEDVQKWAENALDRMVTDIIKAHNEGN